jgi:MFS family permease
MVFGLMPLVVALLAYLAWRAPAAAPPASAGSAALALRFPYRRATLLATLVVAGPATALGMMFVVGSLGLAAAGAGAGVIAAAFVASATAEASANPISGRLVDRFGTRPILIGGLAATAAAFVLLGVADTTVLLIVLIVLISAGLGFCWSPATVRMHDAVRDSGAGDGHAFAFFNLVWAGGQVVGSTAAGGLGQLGGDALPCALMSAALVLVLGAIVVSDHEADSINSTKMEVR